MVIDIIEATNPAITIMALVAVVILFLCVMLVLQHFKNKRDSAQLAETFSKTSAGNLERTLAILLLSDAAHNNPTMQGLILQAYKNEIGNRNLQEVSK